MAVSKPWRRVVIETEIAHLPGFFSGSDADAIVTGSHVFTVTGNVMAGLPRVGPLRPYVVTGVGAVHVGMRDVLDLFPVSEWQLMFNAGVGVMVPAGSRISVGADARYFRSRRGDGAESSIGFGTTFVGFWRLSARVSIRVTR